MSAEKINLNVLLHQVGVNMGDHAETVVSAQDVDPSETVGELAERLLTRMPWNFGPEKARKVEDGWRIEIRVAAKVNFGSRKDEG